VPVRTESEETAYAFTQSEATVIRIAMAVMARLHYDLGDSRVVVMVVSTTAASMGWCVYDITTTVYRVTVCRFAIIASRGAMVVAMAGCVDNGTVMGVLRTLGRIVAHRGKT